MRHSQLSQFSSTKSTEDLLFPLSITPEVTPTMSQKPQSSTSYSSSQFSTHTFQMDQETYLPVPTTTFITQPTTVIQSSQLQDASMLYTLYTPTIPSLIPQPTTTIPVLEPSFIDESSLSSVFFGTITQKIMVSDTLRSSPTKVPFLVEDSRDVIIPAPTAVLVDLDLTHMRTNEETLPSLSPSLLVPIETLLLTHPFSSLSLVQHSQPSQFSSKKSKEDLLPLSIPIAPVFTSEVTPTMSQKPQTSMGYSSLQFSTHSFQMDQETHLPVPTKTFITQPTTVIQLQDASMLYPLYNMSTLPAFIPQPTTTIPVLEPSFIDRSLLSSVFLGTMTQRFMISETLKSLVERSSDVIIPSPTAVLVDLDPTQMHTSEEILPSLSPSLLVPIETVPLTHLFSSLSLVRHLQLSQVSSTDSTEDLLLPPSMSVAPAFASELTESQKTQSSIGYSSLKVSTHSFRTDQETYLPVPTTTHPFVSPSKLDELTSNPLNVQLTVELPASSTYLNPSQETILPSAVSNDAIVPSSTTMTNNFLLPLPMTSSSYPFLYTTKRATVASLTNTYTFSSVTAHTQTIMFDSIFPLPSSSLRPAPLTSPLLPYPSTISTSELDNSVTSSYLELVQDVSVFFLLYTTTIPTFITQPTTTMPVIESSQLQDALMLFPLYMTTLPSFMPQPTTTVSVLEQSFIAESSLSSVFLGTITQKTMISDTLKSSPTKVQFSVEDSRDVIIPSPTAVLVDLDPTQMHTNEELLPSLSPSLLIPIETLHSISFHTLVQHSQLSQFSSTQSTEDLLLPLSMSVAPAFTSEVTPTKSRETQSSMGYSSLQFSTHSFQTDQETYLSVPTTTHPFVSPSKLVEVTSNPLNVKLTMELPSSSTFFNPSQETILPSTVSNDVIVPSLTTITDNLLLPLPMTSSSYPFLYISETSKVKLSLTSTSTVTSFTNTQALSSVTSRNQTVMFDSMFPLPSSSSKPASMTSPLLPYPSTISTSEMDDSVTSSYLEQVQDVSMLFPLYTTSIPTFITQPTTTIPVLEPSFVDESVLPSAFLGTITQKVMMISDILKSSPTKVQFSVERSRDVIIASPTAMLVDLNPTQMSTNEEILPSLSSSLLVPIETLLLTNPFSSLSLVQYSQSQISSTQSTDSDLLLPPSMPVTPVFTSEVTQTMSQQPQSSMGPSTLQFSTHILPSAVLDGVIVTSSTMTDNILLPLSMTSSSYPFLYTTKTATVPPLTNTYTLSSVTSHNQTIMLDSIFPLPSSSLRPASMTSPLLPYPSTISSSEMDDSVTSSYLEQVQDVSMLFPLYTTTVPTFIIKQTTTTPVTESSQLHDASMVYPLYTPTLSAFIPQPTTTIPVLEPSFVGESLFPSVFLGTITPISKYSPIKVHFSVEDSRDEITPSPTAVLVDLDPTEMHTFPSLSPSLVVPIETVPLTHLFSPLSLVRHSQLSQVSSTHSTEDLLLPLSMSVAPAVTSELTPTKSQQTQSSMGYSSLQFSTHSFQTDQETYFPVPTAIHPFVSPSKLVEVTSNPLHVQLTMELPASSTFFNPSQETIFPSTVSNDVIVQSLTTMTDNLLLPIPVTSSLYPFLYISETSTATVRSFTNTHTLSSVTSRNQTIMFDSIFPLPSSSLRPASLTSPLLPYPSTISSSEMDDSVTTSYLGQVQDVSMLFPLYTTSIPTFITQPTTTLPVIESSQLQDASMLFPFYASTSPAFIPQPTTTIPVFEQSFVDEFLLPRVFLGTITQKLISDILKSSPTKVHFSVERSRDVIIASPTAMLVDLDPTQMSKNEEILPSLSLSLPVPTEIVPLTHPFSSLSLVRHSQLSQFSPPQSTEDLLLPPSMSVAPTFTPEVTLTMSQQTQSSIGYSSLQFSTQIFQTDQETYLPVPITIHPLVSPSKVVELTSNPLNVQLTMELPASSTYFNPSQETILPSTASNTVIVPSLTTMTNNLLLHIPVTSSSYPFLYISETSTAIVRSFTNTHALSSVTSRNQTVMFDSIFPLPSSSLRPASMTSPLLPYPSTISTSEMDDSRTNSYLEQVQDVSMLFPLYTASTATFITQPTTNIELSQLQDASMLFPLYTTTIQTFITQPTTTIPVIESSQLQDVSILFPLYTPTFIHQPTNMQLTMALDDTFPASSTYFYETVTSVVRIDSRTHSVTFSMESLLLPTSVSSTDMENDIFSPYFESTTIITTDLNELIFPSSTSLVTSSPIASTMDLDDDTFQATSSEYASVIARTASDDKVSIFPSSTLSVAYSPSSSDVEMPHISTVETLTSTEKVLLPLSQLPLQPSPPHTSHFEQPTEKSLIYLRGTSSLSQITPTPPAVYVVTSSPMSSVRSMDIESTPHVTLSAFQTS